MINRHITIITLFIATVIAASSCRHILPQEEKENQQVSDTAVSENYTGLKRYYSEGRLVKEITYKEGLKNGICNNYYDDGRLKRTIIYNNNLKTDTAKWYYPEGMVYRQTPYLNDKIHGVQTKYYKNGRKQAEMPYHMGLRMPGLKEYYEDGRELTGIPKITSDITDSRWQDEGILRVIVRLDNGSTNVKYYRGSLINGAFDPEQCRDITISSGMGFTEMKRSDTGGKNYVDIIAVYTTRFRNREIIATRIKLPYNNLI
jgi:antitoxin component YwqK of YwqJK toxin-antitoxin module